MFFPFASLFFQFVFVSTKQSISTSFFVQLKISSNIITYVDTDTMKNGVKLVNITAKQKIQTVQPSNN